MKNALIGTLLFCTVILSGATPVASPYRRVVIAGRYYAYWSDAARRFGCRFLRTPAGIELQKNGAKLVIAPDFRSILFNGTRLTLCYPSVVRQGVPFVSLVDLFHTVEPLFAPRQKIQIHRMKNIIIDPGHGGTDQGAAGRLIKEKYLTLKLSKKIAERLRAKGFRVMLTRPADVTRSLPSRPALANANGADLFLSIHANSAKSSISGLETFALTPPGGVSSNGGKESRQILAGHRYSCNNLLLAYLIQQGMHRRTQAVDRSVKRAKFAVLRDVKCPAVLIECGFLSNPAEERQLTKDAYLNKIADGIVDAVLRYREYMKPVIAPMKYPGK